MSNAKRPPSLPPGYELVRFLASGGMAEVYLVRHVDLDVLHVLKVVSPALSGNETFWLRFQREQQIAARLGAAHRNIIRVHHFGRLPSGEPFALLEYFERGSLHDLGATPRKASGHAAVCGILRDVASALCTLADQQPEPYVHRDLKPQNILIGEQRGGPYGVLADFGLARAVDDASLTGPAERVLSPPYAAPEQFRGDRLSPATDVYALGVTACQVLTGRLPLLGDSPQAFQHAHLHLDPHVPRPSDERLLPMKDLMRRSLAKAPSARPLASEWEHTLGKIQGSLGR